MFFYHLTEPKHKNILVIDYKICWRDRIENLTRQLDFGKPPKLTDDTGNVKQVDVSRYSLNVNPAAARIRFCVEIGTLRWNKIAHFGTRVRIIKVPRRCNCEASICRACRVNKLDSKVEDAPAYISE